MMEIHCVHAAGMHGYRSVKMGMHGYWAINGYCVEDKLKRINYSRFIILF